MRYLAAALVMSVSLSLASCSYFLPSTTPSAFGLLADKGDTRPFEKPLPINTQPKRLALGNSFAIGVKEDGTVWSWGSESNGELGLGTYFSHTDTPKKIPNMSDFLEKKGIVPIQSELTRIPSTTVELNEEQAKEVLELVDKIEQDEDVQKVYHNLK